jgi:hypothetical protein
MHALRLSMLFNIVNANIWGFVGRNPASLRMTAACCLLSKRNNSVCAPVRCAATAIDVNLLISHFDVHVFIFRTPRGFTCVAVYCDSFVRPNAPAGGAPVQVLLLYLAASCALGITAGTFL